MGDTKVPNMQKDPEKCWLVEDLSTKAPKVHSCSNFPQPPQVLMLPFSGDHPSFHFWPPLSAQSPVLLYCTLEWTVPTDRALMELRSFLHVFVTIIRIIEYPYLFFDNFTHVNNVSWSYIFFAYVHLCNVYAYVYICSNVWMHAR